MTLFIRNLQNLARLQQHEDERGRIPWRAWIGFALMRIQMIAIGHLNSMSLNTSQAAHCALKILSTSPEERVFVSTMVESVPNLGIKK